MKIGSNQLLSDLKQLTLNHITYVEALAAADTIKLQQRVEGNSWNALECLEHLNLYGRFYLPVIEECMKSKAHLPSETYFISGMLGNYFAKSLWPKDKLNKMKTFKNMNPIFVPLDVNVISIFLQQLHKMLALLKMAETVSLNKIKTPISISSLIRLKLGDTFRVVIYHNERHIRQIKRVLAALERQ